MTLPICNLKAPKPRVLCEPDYYLRRLKRVDVVNVVNVGNRGCNSECSVFTGCRVGFTFERSVPYSKEYRERSSAGDIYRQPLRTSVILGHTDSVADWVLGRLSTSGVRARVVSGSCFSPWRCLYFMFSQALSFLNLLLFIGALTDGWKCRRSVSHMAELYWQETRTCYRPWDRYKRAWRGCTKTWPPFVPRIITCCSICVRPLRRLKFLHNEKCLMLKIQRASRRFCISDGRSFADVESMKVWGIEMHRIVCIVLSPGTSSEHMHSVLYALLSDRMRWGELIFLSMMTKNEATQWAPSGKEISA